MSNRYRSILSLGSSTPPFSNVNSFSFDGVDDYFLVPDTSGLSFGNGTTDSPFSISFWVNLNSLSGNNNVFIGKDNGSPNREYGIGMFSNNNYVRFFIKNQGGNNQQSVDSTTNLSIDTWYHVACTYDGRGGSNAADGMNIYVNAVQETTGLIKQSYTAMSNTIAPFTIGKYSAAPSQVNGKMDEVAIFSSELSQSDITAIYNNGEPQSLDAYSPFVWFRMGDNATWNGFAWTMTSVGTDTRTARSANMVEANRTTDVPTASSFANTKSILLDGVDDYVNCGNDSSLQFNNLLSVSAWVKTSTSGKGILAIRVGNTPTQEAFSLTSSGEVRMNNGTRLTANTSILDNNWHHIVVTYNTSLATNNLKIYIDGSLDNSVNRTVVIQGSGTNYLIIGESRASNFFNGILDEVSVFNTEL